MGKIEEVDEEEEEPENKDNIDTKIEAYKKRLDNKTNNIQQLQEELKETTKKLNFDLSMTHEQGELDDEDMDATSYDTPFNISEIEGTDEEPEEVDNSLGKVFENKIKDLES